MVVLNKNQNIFSKYSNVFRIGGGAIVSIFAILGLVAFILHFTSKRECYENYNSPARPPPNNKNTLPIKDIQQYIVNKLNCFRQHVWQNSGETIPTNSHPFPTPVRLQTMDNCPQCKSQGYLGNSLTDRAQGYADFLANLDLNQLTTNEQDNYVYLSSMSVGWAEKRNQNLITTPITLTGNPPREVTDIQDGIDVPPVPRNYLCYEFAGSHLPVNVASGACDSHSDQSCIQLNQPNTYWDPKSYSDTRHKLAGTMGCGIADGKASQWPWGGCDASKCDTKAIGSQFCPIAYTQNDGQEGYNSTISCAGIQPLKNVSRDIVVHGLHDGQNVGSAKIQSNKNWKNSVDEILSKWINGGKKCMRGGLLTTVVNSCNHCMDTVINEFTTNCAQSSSSDPDAGPSEGCGAMEFTQLLVRDVQFIGVGVSICKITNKLILVVNFDKSLDYALASSDGWDSQVPAWGCAQDVFDMSSEQLNRNIIPNNSNLCNCKLKYNDQNELIPWNISDCK